MAQDYAALAQQFGGQPTAKKPAGTQLPGGGMIISDPTAIRELQLKEAAAGRDAAALELRMREAEGGNVPTGYRRRADGGLEFIPGGPADPAAKAPPANPNRAPQIQSALEALANIRKLAEEPLSVGEAAGRIRSTPLIGAIAGQNRANLEGALSQIEGNLIQDQLRELARINPGGVASLANSETEARRLASSIANLDPNQSIDQFLTGVKRAEDYYNRQLEMVGGAPADAQGEQGRVVTAPGTTGGTVVGAIQGGQPIMTPQDMEAGKAIQEAWNRTGRFADVQAVAAQYGRSFGQEEAAFLQANEGKPVTINANPTGQPTAAEEAVGEFVSTPMGEAVGAGIVGGANTFTLGQLDDLAPMLGFDPQRVQAAKDFLRQQAPVSTLAGEVAGGLLPAAGFGRAAQTLTAGSPLASLAPALGDVAFGASFGAGEAPEGERGMGALLGGATAGLAGAAGRRLFGGGQPPTPPAAPPSGGVVSQAVRDAEQAGINVMTSDVAPPRTFVGRSAQFTGERIPFAGTGGLRATQAEQRVQAVQNLVQDYGAVAPTDVPKRIYDAMIAKRGAEIQNYTRQKREVIDRLSDAGQVPLIATGKAINEVISSLRSRRTPAADEAADAIERIGQQLNGRSLSELEAYRQDVLANIFKDEAAFSVGARDVGEKALRRIYDPVRQDMGDFIKQTGERRDFTKWMVANKRLAEEAGELKNQTLKSVLRRGDATPEAVERLLFSSKPSDVKALYRTLPEDGKAAARLAIVNRVFQDAGGDLATVSPEKFISAAKKQGDAIGVFFDGAEGARLQGLLRALQLTQRASQAAVSPVTGAQTFLPSLFTGLVAGLGSGATAATATLAIGGLARAYESKAMRNLLLQMKNAPDNSPQAAQIAQSITDKLRDAAIRSSAGVGAQEVTEDAQ
jgi:hypothetical protein